MTKEKKKKETKQTNKASTPLLLNRQFSLDHYKKVLATPQGYPAGLVRRCDGGVVARKDKQALCLLFAIAASASWVEHFALGSGHGEVWAEHGPT